MSIAELVPAWPTMPDPVGPRIDGASLRGRSYRLRSDSPKSLDCAGVLDARGIVDGREAFLSPRLDRDMPDPLALIDMDKAASRMARAVLNREKVLVFGDYDVDGASSVAVIVRWMREFGLEPDTYVPDRITEGYGPTQAAFDRALTGDHDLVIFVDCGTASAGLIDAMVEDVIVIDHHKVQHDVPQVVALVNPHRPDDTSGLGMLCAAALSFMFVVASQRAIRERDPGAHEPRLSDLLDIVALATVADVVPLIGPSRLFVAKGLEIMRKRPSTGIAALMLVAGVEEVSSTKIGFALGPRINAGGRVGVGTGQFEGALGLELLICRDGEKAAEIARRLDGMNRERQDVERKCLDEAMASAAVQAAEGHVVISVFGEGWHPGVVGIVAGRIKEKYDMPAIVGAFDGTDIKASGRSVPGFDLGAVIVEAAKRGILSRGGGHAMACGLSCKAENWAEFVKFLRKRTVWTSEAIVIDCRVAGHEIMADEIERLDTLQPLGQGMPAVRVVVEGLKVVGVRTIGNGHVKLDLGGGRIQMEGIWWRARDDGFEDILEGMKGATVTVIGCPKINEWKGRRSISFDLADIISGGFS